MDRPDQCRMHEGAVCLGMQRRGEGTLPKHPGNWGTGPSQEAQGVLQPQQVQSLPRSPQHIQPWQPSLHLPRTALTSYSLRKPMCDLAAF